MRDVSGLRRDREGLTAVIEFLSAFTLFLMILTAFLALAQMQMGSNDPYLDRLDRSAVLGLDRLVADEGWYVPVVDGEADVANGTSAWHEETAAALEEGRVRAGLVVDGILDEDRLAALSKVTEQAFAAGLGLDAAFDVHLRIDVLDGNGSTESTVFDGGTTRIGAETSSRATRLVVGDGALYRVSLEVHDGGRASSVLQVTEVQPHPDDGGPEWFEMHNPEGFAVRLLGWSFHVLDGRDTTSHLMLDGLISGGGVAVFTGDANTQEVGNATQVFDLGVYGLLGVGQIDVLPDDKGQLRIDYTDPTTSLPATRQAVLWGGDTGHILASGDGLTWNGTDLRDMADWSVTGTASPGDWTSVIAA